MRPRAGEPVVMSSRQVDALDWTATSSSNVQAVAFDDGRLFVRFGPESVYRYDDVPAPDHEALLEASKDPGRSVGKLLHRLVKAVRVCHRVVTDEPDA